MSVYLTIDISRIKTRPHVTYKLKIDPSEPLFYAYISNVKIFREIFTRPRFESSDTDCQLHRQSPQIIDKSMKKTKKPNRTHTHTLDSNAHTHHTSSTHSHTN